MKGTKLGEGIRDLYIRDFYHFRDSGFLSLGLFHLGKVCGAKLITTVKCFMLTLLIMPKRELRVKLVL